MATDESFELTSIQHIHSHRLTIILHAETINQVLSSLLSRRGYARVMSTSSLEAAWQSACGERFAGDTRAGIIRRGTLEILVRSAVITQELTFLKKKLLEKLKASAPDHKIKD